MKTKILSYPQNQLELDDKLHDLVEDLRNESNIFSVDRSINQKRTKHCINARSALLQKLSVLLDQPKKYL